MDKIVLDSAYKNLSGEHFVLYVDETFNRPEEKLDHSFYVVCGVLVQEFYLEETRRELLEIVGQAYWHTTEALQTDEGHAKAEELLEYCRRVRDCHVFAYKKNLPKQGDANEVVSSAREECLRELLIVVQRHCPGLRLIVIEKRQTNAQNDADRRVVKSLRAEKRLSRHARLLLVSPKDEYLLWLPDLSAMAFRRSKTHKDKTSYYFEQFLGEISIVNTLD